jgi:hypothetical protein
LFPFAGGEADFCEEIVKVKRKFTDCGNHTTSAGGGPIVKIGLRKEG